MVTKKSRTTKRGAKNRGADDNGCLVDKANRTVYLTGEITQRIASVFRKHIRALEKTGSPIIVEINSPGGDMESGIAMMDTIRTCKSPVTTLAAGQACSMASLVLAAGTKRQALKNSTIMVHQGCFTLRVLADEIDTEIGELKRLEALTWDLLDTATGKQLGYWKALCAGKNKYLSADDAKAEGLIDEVL